MDLAVHDRDEYKEEVHTDVQRLYRSRPYSPDLAATSVTLYPYNAADLGHIGALVHYSDTTAVGCRPIGYKLE